MMQTALSPFPVEEAFLFDAAGPQDAPAILFLHGSVLTRKMWLPQMRAIAGSYRAIAPDLPGHGTLAGTPFRLESAVQVVAGTIEQNVGGSTLVVGASLGGYVAMALAERHPELVAGLVLAGATTNFTGALGLYVRVIGALIARVLPEGHMIARMERRVAEMFAPSLADVAQAQLAAGVYPRAAGEAFLELAGRDFRASLRAFPGPVVIVNGERDRANRRGEAAFLAAAAQAAAHTIPGAGHACSIDRPEEFAQVVRAFAETVFHPASLSPTL